MANILGFGGVLIFLVGTALIIFNSIPVDDDYFSYRETSWFDEVDSRTSRFYWGKKLFLDSAILLAAMAVLLSKLPTF